MRSGIAVASRRHKFAGLLLLLLAALTIQSFDVQLGVPELLSDAFRTVLGVAILVVVFERPRERVAMASILAVFVVIGWWHLVSGAVLGHALSLTLYALLALFQWVAVWVILRDLFRKATIGAENVLGAICGYLIAGDAWGGVNAFAYVLAPAAYNINPDVSALLVGWHGRMALFSYYGFAQMLTIGYSDVTPVRAPATTLSLLGALFGVFYTAVVVSQLVGMAQSRKGEAP
jgi:voltage-gated potassium channel Kch